MRYADTVATLIEHGWTKTHYARWEDARAHNYTTFSRRGNEDVVSTSQLGWALRVKPTHRYDRDRGAYTVSWANHAKTADVWVSTPDERGNQVAIAMVFDADGRVVRQIHVQSGWKPHTATNEDVSRTARRESPQGRESARLASLIAAQEREERTAKLREDQERMERLTQDARELLEQGGYDPEMIQVTQMGKVVIDLEDFLSIMRAATYEDHY